jgi:hypothetical protein
MAKNKFADLLERHTDRRGNINWDAIEEEMKGIRKGLIDDVKTIKRAATDNTKRRASRSGRNS